MKKRISFLLLLMSISIFGWSHYITDQCWNSGRYKLLASAMPPGKTCTIKLISNTGHWDTTFTVQTNSFSFTVPQPNRLNPVRVEVKTSDGYEVEVWTNSGVCSSLPLKLVDWKLEPIGDNKGLLTLVVEDVTGVSHINIMASVLGRTLQIVATLKPDNYNYQKTYTATIDLNNPK